MRRTQTAPRTISASTLKGDKVVNQKGEDIGKIDEIMLDTSSGRIQYVVLSFGGFMGMGDKLFAIPWNAFSFSAQKEDELILNIEKEKLKASDGFDKDNWPDTSDAQWQEDVYTRYGYQPYW